MAVRTKVKFTMGKVFPAADPVARWLVTMSVGVNDVIFANSLAIKAEKAYERIYFFRLAASHLWELAKFITETRKSWDEIQRFVAELPQEAQAHLEAIEQIHATGDIATMGTELVQIRDLFAHYQAMDAQARDKPRDPITRALEELATEETELEVGEQVHELRLGYADEVVARTVLRLIPDEAAQKHFLSAVADGLGHVVTFTQLTLNAWLEPRSEMLERID